MWLAGSGGKKSFLSKAITNAAASWQNKGISARIRTGLTTEVGVRVDDGTDDNYAELYVTGALANATQRLDFRYRTGGGSPTVVSSGLIIPCDTFVVVDLVCYWSGSQYFFYGYLHTEDGMTVNISGFSTPAVTWCPAAGRVGLFGNLDNGNYGSFDFFSSSFT